MCVIRKPKTPDNKAIFLLFIAIFFCHALQGVSACFGPVEKIKIFNDRRDKGNGYVAIKNKQVFARKDTDVFLYKISTEQKDHRVSFYLYDPTAKKFICWNPTLERVVGMDFKKVSHHNHWPYCKFIDNPSERQAYLELLWASNSTVKMKFNQKGRNFTPKVLKNCKKRAKPHVRQRHMKHCTEYGEFLISRHQCRQEEAYDIFCKGDLRTMSELKGICRVMKKRLKTKNTTLYN